MHAPQSSRHAQLNEAQRDASSVDLALAAMDATGVDAAVFAAGVSVSELAIKEHPSKFGAVLIVPSDMPEMAQEVERLRDRPGFLGIRITEPSWPPTGEGIAKLHAGVWEPALAAAEKRGIPVQLFFAGNLQHAEPVLRSHPNLKVNLIHFGLFRSPTNMRFQGADPFEQLPLLLKLAEFPNVVVQLSNGPGLSREQYPYRDLWPHLHRILKAYGPERLMWGSDFTRNRGVFHYHEWVDFLRDTTEVSEHDKELLFGVTLRRFYDWPKAA